MSNEIKRERFIRVAEARTNKILEMLRLLGNCSNKLNYEYSDEDVKKIFGVLEKEIENTKNLFLGKDISNEKFTLEDMDNTGDDSAYGAKNGLQRFYKLNKRK